MSVVVYPAVVTTSEAGEMRGRFPDLPAIAFAADAAADLLVHARDALARELQRLEAAGEGWPQATAFPKLDVPPGASVMLVDVSVDDPPVRLTVSLGERLLQRIDQDAEARSMTRSGYLALGARRLLSERPGAAPGGAHGWGDGGQALRDDIADLGRRVNEAVGPNSPVGRTLAELDAIALDGLRRLGAEFRSAVRGRGREDGAPPPPSAGAEAPPPQATPEPPVTP